MSPTRVFHCDDSGSFVVLVRHWLEDHADLEWVGAERDPARVPAAVAGARADVALLDTMGRGPRDDGLLRAIRAAAPDARVIVYSAYVGMLGPDQLGAGAADGYLDKSEDDAALVALIRRVTAPERSRAPRDQAMPPEGSP